MRQFVFALFLLAFIAVVAAIVVFIATVIVRGGISVLHAVAANGMPRVIAVLSADPWYVVALIIAVLFLWSYPWELENGGPSSPVRRGRQVANLSAARRRVPQPRVRRASPSARVRGTSAIQRRSYRQRRI